MPEGFAKLATAHTTLGTYGAAKRAIW